jgi:glycosyltransferase involved in cell wall biosynthesis
MQKSLDQAVAQGCAIVCVSEATKAELLDYAGAHLEPRVEVVHEGVAALPQGAGRAAMANRDLPPAGVPFVLATGKISPRKNILGVMEAMAELVGTLPHHLVIAGGDGWAVADVYAAVKRLGLEGRTHFPGFVTDAELGTLYAEAAVYVHPSFYEGFGLTVLEAMAAGTPVITADRSSLPEVAGEAALLVDPADVNSLAHAVLRIATDEALAADLRARGRARATTFTWDAAAEAMEKIYRERM